MKVTLVLFLAVAAAASTEDRRCSNEPAPYVGMCRRSMKIWFYNSTIGNCEQRVVDYCEHNQATLSKDHFVVESTCNKVCRDLKLGDCAIVPEEDICRGHFVMYRFNPDKARCESFGYGGCADKRGLFDTAEQCEKKCGQYAKDPCVQPIDEGRTCQDGNDQGMPVFGFNPKTQKCEEFFYKGCGGNGNNFIEPKECWQTCKAYVKNRCNFPIHAGLVNCPKGKRADMYGYNAHTNRCEKFGYFGCGGYDNRFPTAKECWRNCTDPSTLNFPTTKCLEPGFKHSYRTFKRFFYNIETDQCEASSYWFLDNRKNRFGTLQECEKICKPRFEGYPRFPISNEH